MGGGGWRNKVNVDMLHLFLQVAADIIQLVTNACVDSLFVVEVQQTRRRRQLRDVSLSRRPTDTFRPIKHQIRMR